MYSDASNGHNHGIKKLQIQLYDKSKPMVRGGKNLERSKQMHNRERSADLGLKVSQ